MSVSKRRVRNPRKFHVKSGSGKKGCLDGTARLCGAVYVQAFYAIRQASDILREDPLNINAQKDWKEAKEFLYSANPFRNYLEAVGHEFPIEEGIDSMVHGSRDLLFGKTGLSGRHTDPKKINEVRNQNGNHERRN